MAGIRRVSIDGTDLATFGLVFNTTGIPLHTAYGLLTFGLLYGYGEVWFNEDNGNIVEAVWEDCDCLDMCS